MPEPGCAFCTARIAQLTLWESEHYRVFADEYPRCVGHVLLVSKDHLSGHMDEPGVLVEVRRLTVARAGGALEPSGGLRRGGAEMVERTRELWRGWSLP